ncbi:MAG: 3-isopropylmalate dehydratase small subunit [Thermoplasmata archaeon]|nr:3-isopropylmalate dehydratase small subunit [Thermoplasmata archaeon]
MLIKGKVIKYGDDINTDVIYPGRYLDIIDAEEMAKHAMEDLDARFHEKVKNANIIVAGKNFGCGSSREQAATCLKYAGIDAIIAKSFARIFFRNAINQGMLVIESAEADRIDDGDEIEIDAEKGVIRNITKGEKIIIKPIPEFLMEIVKAGGLVEYVRRRI